MPKWGNNKMLDVCRYAVQRIRNSRPLNSLCNQTRLALLHGEKRTSNRRMLDIRPSFPITLPQRSRNERSSSGRTRGEKKRERERGGGKVEKKRGGGREKKAAYIHLGNHGDFVSTPCALNVAVFPRVPNRKLNEPCAILVLGRPSCETSWNKSAGEVDRIVNCVNGVKGVM